MRFLRPMIPCPWVRRHHFAASFDSRHEDVSVGRVPVEERVICFGAVPMDESHPRGTLAIVAVLGAFFALGWLAMFLFLFLERGAPQP
jgi:cytochrome c oxidase subunit IIa family protein